MSERDGRRKCDNGVRKALRDFLPPALAISVIFASGVFYQAQAENKKRILNLTVAQKEMVQIQRQRAREMGKVEEGLRLVQEQNRLILQTLLKRK